MFVLDTNVVSEMMKAHPKAEVMAWLDEQLVETLFITTITEAEIRSGIAYLPIGRRRQALNDAAEMVFESYFSERNLPFDRRAAQVYAVIAAESKAAGYTVSHADCQIAAIARLHGGGVATRNVRDFIGFGIQVLDPWESQVT